MENTALFFHLLGAFLFVSGSLLAAIAFETARRRTSVGEIAALLGLARIGALLVASGFVLVLVFGLWLVNLGDWGSGAGWINGAMVLLFVAVVTGAIGGQTPKRARRLATELAVETKPVSAELRALLDHRASQILNYASGLALVAIVVLMVWKPGA